MMHNFDKDPFVVPEPKIFNKKMKHYDDNIFTWDIETVSLFEIDCEYQPFDYSKDAKFYKDVNKAAVPYIWMFGCWKHVSRFDFTGSAEHQDVWLLHGAGLSGRVAGHSLALPPDGPRAGAAFESPACADDSRCLG